MPNGSIRLFADDTSLTMSGNNLHNLVNSSKIQFEKLLDWCYSNKLCLNSDKTNYMIFHTKNKMIQEEFNCIEVGGMKLEKVSSVKYIGVCIDDMLKWNDHVNYVCKSLMKYFGIFNNIKHYVTSKIARQLYFSFVFSRICYGIEVYGTCSLQLINKMQTIQNRLLKMLLNLDIRSSTNSLHHNLNILKITDIYKVNIVNFTNKWLRDELPLCFKTYFQIHQPVYSTRSASSLCEKRYRTVGGSLCIKLQGSKLVNNLNASIQSLKGRKCLKKKYAKYIISTYVDN